MIYKMQIPPFPVKSFDLLTTRQAKEIFKWYTDDIPARLDQLQKCIDADVNGTVQLTRGKDSLRPLWSWLVANIQLQELTESDLKESLDAVPKWLHEYIVAGKYKLTTESLSIGMDVAIYLGEVFVHEFPQIYWGFFTKPKSRVSVNEPVLLGFENGLDMNPRRIVDTLMWQCANGKSSEGLYESFNRFLIISLDVLICRYSPSFRAFPALFISEEPHKSFYYPSCFRSQK